MSISHISFLTYPVILIAVFARQMCLPVPAVLLLMMAGALGESGKLSLPAIILTGVVGCLLADFAWFEAGRLWGSRILRILCSFSTDRRYCAQRARDVFARWGLRTLMVAKFIPGLDGVMPPLSGMEGAGAIEFLLFDAVGALLWSSAYCLIGYLFADRVNVVAAELNRASGALAIVLGIPFACYLLWRAWELFLMVHQLRIRTISPALLQEKLAAGRKVAVLDLILLEADALPDTTPGIPGAIRINPARLRTSSKVHVPDDVDIVLYCSSSKEMTSARAAVSLRHKGISKVWVLEGGLKAWQKLNLPMATELGNPEETAARFGIEVATRRHKGEVSLPDLPHNSGNRRKPAHQLWSVLRTLTPHKNGRTGKLPPGDEE
ncbi:membrane protein DedA with SNARE-associated domain/rhodanese-related sulfurtransferase [Silvibacterium bohemicum]|uniref:Membrane protein DedA with SNARE-associated domain/rhodanese-related sulfurtransferase n=1 Tax=Silvibacterium bohemicum TaxID=1577686 RepID=A0A841K0W7_9BACT|nr:VTT domain-containing protein [Silvibacterium bohemicum]MBB6143884.1 membrane protein DedA with SNARE-associated domain/rhodanese-related sulfurtransferase [Silvibacterium bohemicum]